MKTMTNPSSDLTNQPFELFRGNARYTTSRSSFETPTILTWRWLPSPSVLFEIDDAPFSAGFLGGGTVALPSSIGPAKTVCTSARMGSHEPTRLKGQITEIMEVGDGSGLMELRFRIPNFAHFYAFDGKPSKSPLDRIHLAADGWVIDIDPVAEIDDIHAELQISGGFGVTHHVTAKRADGSEFDSVQARHLMSALYHFLSFVQGNWTGAILPEAFADGARKWQAWGPWRLSPHQDVLSWADRHRGHELANVFSGYFSKFNDPNWQRVVGRAIFWCIESNRNESGLEAGILLTLGAIDSLAWQYLVLDTQQLSKRKFKELSMANRIRQLCCTAKIPLAFDKSTDCELAKLSGTLGWADLADAVADVRNNIMHPDASMQSQIWTDDVLKDTWLNAVWILELILLWLFDYRGEYLDRRGSLFVGATTKVPWS